MTPKGSPAQETVASSYKTILKSSSIIGGSQVLVYAIGLIRTKLVAVLLGPSGVGLIGILNAIISVGSTLANCGLQNSGTREIAVAKGQENTELIAEIRLAIYRTASVLGLLGALILVALSPYISQWMFESQEYSIAIALLASILFFNGVNVAQKATIQGHRRIKDLAKLSILSALGSVILALALYLPFRHQGIVPVLILISVTNVSVAWLYSRKLAHRPQDASWERSWTHSKRLVGLGMAVAYGLLLAELIPFYAKFLVTKNLGVDANGIYTAAFAISGLLVSFVLTAMAADYFPRLSAAAHDTAQRNRIINEQTQIGVLIALPGVLVAFAFAPILLRTLYSEAFLPGAELMRFFLIGVFARVINFPVGYLLLATGHSRRFAGAQTLTVSIHILLITLLFSHFHLVGPALAFAANNCLVFVIYSIGASLLYSFRWQPDTARLVLIAFLFLFAMVAVHSVVINPHIKTAISIALIALACLYGFLTLQKAMPGLSLRSLLQKLQSKF